MEFRNVIKCKIENGIAEVTVDHAPVNALNIDVVLGLGECFDALGRDDAVRAVIVTGEGKAFIAGADLREILDGGDDFLRQSSMRGHKVYRRIEEFPLPTIAAVNGAAMGGGLEVAICCDIVLASERAKFGLPETILGMVPGWGGMSRLTRRIGIGQIKKMVFTGLPIGGAEAKEIGLAHEVHAPEGLLPRARELAAQIAKNGPIALREAKKVLNAACEISLDEAVKIEIDAVAFCGRTSDKHEGVEAFLNKRPPSFSNR